jgi:putative heme iron utilization protein
MGEVRPATSPNARLRFLGRHPSAREYVDFADFAFHTLAVESAHFIGGFGRIVPIARDDVLIPCESSQALIAAEPEILAHMNNDHADAISLYATVLARQPPGPWRMAGVDPAGMDLVHCTKSVRLDFPDAVHTPLDARRALATLAKQARAGHPVD